MFIFTNDYIGTTSKNVSWNLKHIRQFYLGTDAYIYLEYNETFERIEFDTKANAAIAYHSIVGMIKALQ